MQTFDVQSLKMELKIIDGSEQNLDMKDKFLGHSNGIKILSIADLSQHVGDASGT